MNPLIPMSIEVISAFFKLGDKYAMTHLRDEALRRLKETYTGNYEDWASRRSAGRQAIDPLLPPDVPLSLSISPGPLVSITFSQWPSMSALNCHQKSWFGASLSPMGT